MASWLEEHLETFVRPVLGEIPNVGPAVAPFAGPYVKPLKALLEAMKKESKGRPIILPGRDVFMPWLVASLDRYPVTFRPDISSAVCGHVSLKGLYHEYYGVDSGFHGSVLKALGVKQWNLASGAKSFASIGYPLVTSSLCGYMEGSHKYWQCGTSEDYPIGPIIQTLSPVQTFRNAAEHTIYMAGQLGERVPRKPTYVLTGRFV